jgi:hypothetical protein
VQLRRGLAGDHSAHRDSVAPEPATEDDLSPEQLARAVFEGAPRPVRWLLLVGFRYGLNLRLASRASPEHVLGWAIIDRDANSITIESRSWYLTSRLLFQTEEARVKLSTYVHYDRPIAKVLWPPVSILHRQILPRLLRHAASDARNSTGSDREALRSRGAV